MSKIYIILPYFGIEFPNYFQLYLDSCNINQDILHVLLITDIDHIKYKIPTNVTVIKSSLDELRIRLQELLYNVYNIKIETKLLICNAYKLCDVRILYGELFQKEINDLNIKVSDYIGFGDCDLIYGKLSNFIDIEKNYAVIGRHGHFLVWKNILEFNTFWRKVSTQFITYSIIPCENSKLKTVFDGIIDRWNKDLDERYFSPQINQYIRDNKCMGLDIYRYVCDIVPPENKRGYGFTSGRHYPDVYKYIVFDQKISKLTCKCESGKEFEIMYVHLQKRKMTVNFKEYTDKFYIKPFTFELEP